VGVVVGIDTGGTFTDMVVFDPASGRLDSLKTSSTPSSPGQAIVNALAEGGISGADLERFTHGTTVGTNALIERTGCRVAFVTTKGFEDTPYIQRIGTHAGWVARRMLRGRRTKHLMRTAYALRSLWQLKRGLSRGDERADYWQAGKSVATITAELPVAEIVGAFADRARASVDRDGPFAASLAATGR